MAPLLARLSSSWSSSRERMRKRPIGVATRHAQANRDAQNVVYEESVAAKEAVSGVNLDEEAANLLKYQQAYQAAAQLIRVADTMFQTLLAATER